MALTTVAEFKIQRLEVLDSEGRPDKSVALDIPDSKALELYSTWLKISVAKAKRTRDDFFKPPAIEPDKIVGLDQIVKDAVDLKFTPKELTKEQLADLIRIPPR